MTWEDKTIMVRFGNENDMENFVKFSKDHLDEIISDEQALDMFIQSVEISKENIIKYLEFFKLYTEKTKEITFDSFSTAMRQTYIEKLTEESL